ncbi:hypothetical protein CHU_3823 [Sporocytophaga myxococcoides]|uniref:Outer membrane protein beta-barrel domain-containing protein n=1 Tax=Sporocytophaga myxococcoides TaxID=153721 RepID=A0A098LEF3_9BACT|nr:hypothetical protein [Sporocytophaga myxococcoides]GAL84794.1 hypothetical protein CHU_3823 [Sporocytophaga myxococcoides]
MRYLIIIFFIYISTEVGAQGVSKFYHPNTFRASISGNCYFQSGTYIYIESSGSYQEGFYIRDFSPFNKLNSVDLGIGVQFQISEKWSGGLSQKLARSQVNGLSYTGFNVEHQGKIKNIDFIKLATLEYRKHINAPVNDLGMIALLGGLHKSIKVKERQLGFMASYRAFKIREIGGDEYSIFRKRFINKTVLRIDVYFEAIKGIYIGLFALRDTNYYPSANAGANDKLNIITPTYGVTLNFVINGKNRLNVLPGMPPLQIVDSFF